RERLIQTKRAACMAALLSYVSPISSIGGAETPESRTAHRACDRGTDRRHWRAGLRPVAAWAASVAPWRAVPWRRAVRAAARYADQGRPSCGRRSPSRCFSFPAFLGFV